MNITEAYQIIGLDKSASDAELKVKYKSLAKEFHPDLNKISGDKFKSINEAYDLIKDYRANPQKYDRPSMFPGGFRRVDMNDFHINLDDFFTAGDFQPQERPKTFRYEQLNVPVSISFKESIIGINKDISYKKYVKCTTCNARGSQLISNGCKNCNGFGKIISNNNGMMFTRPCKSCNGKDVKNQPCLLCKSLGVSEIEANIMIHIPPGIANASTLRLGGAGHYVGGNVFGDAHTDVFVLVNVEQEEGLSLEGANVVSYVKLNLLEALTGCSKEVKTIYDIAKVEIPAKSRNKDEIHLQSKGVVSMGGVQKVILDISYPDNIDDLIDCLKGKES